MKPFSPRMFPDDVVYFRSVPATGGQGASKRTFPFEGVIAKASVQSSVADRTDLQGRVTTMTVHEVRTPTDLGANADDKFLWLGRELTVQAASIPSGIGDVIWITKCLETR